jgi:hypothetical protein
MFQVEICSQQLEICKSVCIFILFSHTVMQMICMWPKILTLSRRLSLMCTVQLMKKMSDASKNIFRVSSSPLLWKLINFRLFCSDDFRSWPRDEKINTVFDFWRLIGSDHLKDHHMTGPRMEGVILWTTKLDTGKV